MKILKAVIEPVEIGPPDRAVRYPLFGRRDIRCDVCGALVLDPAFVAVFKKGHPNLAAHEACALSQGLAIEERRP